MRAQQFIKDHGLERARKVVEGAPEGATQYELTVDGDFYFKRDNFNWFCFGDEGLINTYMDDYETYHLIDLRILKRIVESVDRINQRGYSKTKDHLDYLISYGSEFGHVSKEEVSELTVDLKNYESIYGEGNE